LIFSYWGLRSWQRDGCHIALLINVDGHRLGRAFILDWLA
jgi:hypothetical protein